MVLCQALNADVDKAKHKKEVEDLKSQVDCVRSQLEKASAENAWLRIDMDGLQNKENQGPVGTKRLTRVSSLNTLQDLKNRPLIQPRTIENRNENGVVEIEILREKVCFFMSHFRVIWITYY
jgi:hypothetical protein